MTFQSDTIYSGQMEKASKMWSHWSVVRFVAVVVVATIASAGCFGPPAQVPDPGEPGISLDSPTGGSRVNFPVDGFDLCSPFTHSLFQKWAPVTRAPAERGPGSCRWRGDGVIATITDETGATLAEISHDPRYRPGYTGLEGNRYWVTATPTSPPYNADLFLATGPAQPRRLLHIHVESEDEWAPSPQPDRAYPASGVARLIATSTASRMQEELLSTTAPAPR
jgi:hypothetical protein